MLLLAALFLLVLQYLSGAGEAASPSTAIACMEAAFASPWKLEPRFRHIGRDGDSARDRHGAKIEIARRRETGSKPRPPPASH